MTYHGSGKHQGVVKLWTAGQALIPCDFRVYDKPRGGKTKNEHFQQMLQQARARGFRPDGWLVCRLGEPDFGRLFLTRLKGNRGEGRVVHLRGFGFVQVFRTVSNGEAEHWARG